VLIQQRPTAVQRFNVQTFKGRSTQTDDDFSYVISYAGEENLVIGTDYGHGDTSSELNAISRFKAMEGLNPQVKRKILSDNPRRFYGI
jgi:predicted TIM-barrel fold metal-dependent hydrolase